MTDAALSSPDRFDLPQWLKRILNARFFMIAVIVHVLIVVTFGTKSLFDKYVEPPDFTGEAGSFLEQVAPPPPTPTQPTPEQQLTPNVTPTSTVPSIDAISTNLPTQSTFTIPQITPPSLTPSTTTALAANTPAQPPVGATGLSKEIASGIAGFTAGWTAKGSTGPGSSLRTREFQFTAYLAKYQGGDWASTVQLEGNNIVKGSLPNLLFVMGKLSKDKIRAQPEAIPLDLASDEIFAKKPPFIWFTGHRDFTLTDKEVENLQKYIRLGGCIWGDSSLPGRRSRFDIAFRREMRRVISDSNKQWQELPPTHPIFTKAYYPDIRTVPPGINFYREPIYAIESYGGEIGVIYTANDYGDMWQIGLDENGQVNTKRNEKHQMIVTNEALWDRRELYFRNVEQKALFDSYKFGTNIIIHLVTRWEDKVRNVPKGL